MPALTSRHHTLIQALLSRGPLGEEAFHTLFERISGKNPRAHQKVFNDYLRQINKELGYVQFELRACRNQYDGKIYYGVVNNVADEQSKMGTKYSVPAIAFYRCVVEAIVQDDKARGSISSIEALNIRLENQAISGTGSQSQGDNTPAAFRNFSISQKQKTLDELVQDKWLCAPSDGTVGLGVRSFLDLRSWFQTNELPTCDVCNEAAVKAELCANEGCTVRIHLYCVIKKFTRRAERVCPSCGTQWHCPTSIKQAVEEEDDEPNVMKESQLPPKPSMRKKLRACKAEDAGAESGSSQADPPIPSLRRSTRSASRLR